MDAWAAARSDSIPKAAYDFVWQQAGGSPGSLTYNNALASMGSEIVVVIDPEGLPIEFIRSSPQILISSLNQFLDNFPVPKPCSFRPPGFES